MKQRLGLSPGCFTLKHYLKQAQKRKVQKEKGKEPHFKERRLERKKSRATTESAIAVCEGTATIIVQNVSMICDLVHLPLHDYKRQQNVLWYMSPVTRNASTSSKEGG